MLYAHILFWWREPVWLSAQSFGLLISILTYHPFLSVMARPTTLHMWDYKSARAPMENPILQRTYSLSLDKLGRIRVRNTCARWGRFSVPLIRFPGHEVRLCKWKYRVSFRRIRGVISVNCRRWLGKRKWSIGNNEYMLSFLDLRLQLECGYTRVIQR